jgi:mono/diheme cytochrome c family protein
MIAADLSDHALQSAAEPELAMRRGRARRGHSALARAALAAQLLAPALLHAQAEPRERSGRELYEWSCAACHGADGRGAPPSLVGFDTPLPDFTDCAFATPEADVDWIAVAHRGGPVRAFDRRMPAFGEALTDEEIRRTIGYIRGFCADAAWPRGELNLPRPLVTEKAFPENEAVLTTTIDAGGMGAVGNTFLYEQRIGARSQFEIAIPLNFQESGAGGWTRGLGDVAVALKRVLVHSFDAGTIFSVAGELILPTGKETRGLGKGATVFEPYLAFGQMLPSDSFLQVQAGLELSTNRTRASNEAFWRASLGRTFVENGFDRSWSPIIELLAARELGAGASTHWDVLPQMQVSLSRRQHVLVNAGVQVPITDRDGRSTRILVYLLWDWFDGGFFEGWR